MTAKKDELSAAKAEFLKMAGEAFDRMMLEEQEQVITFEQMEDRALEVGAKLETWLVERQVAGAGRRASAGPVPCCPRCHQPLRMTGGKARKVRARTGPVQFTRPEGYCTRCRKAFFPLGRASETGS